MANEKLDTSQKALQINLDAGRYGTFAEIGAGQEVARWFFRAGGAAGTVAKTISAYDMAVSDAIYGPSQRYVSRQRLHSMLEYEYQLLLARLDKTRELPDDFPRPEQPLSFQIAAPLPLALDFKQELLENRSESERLRLLNRGIARLIRQIDQVEKARTKAGGNGKLRST